MGHTTSRISGCDAHLKTSQLGGKSVYGKLFKSMYDGTLSSSWEALVTFQQLIILADDVGVVDMTPQALSARTGIPVDVIETGLGVLEAKDEYSRTPDLDGRRIERLDGHRPWGWRIVNYSKYRQLASHEHKKAADRERIAKKRAADEPMSQPVARCRGTSQVSQSVADVAHTDTDTDTDTKNSDRPVLSEKRVSEAFEKFWKKYPRRNGRRDGKKAALEAFKKIPIDKWPDLNTALTNLNKAVAENDLLPKDAFRWLRDGVWQDFLEPTGEPLDVANGRRLVRRALDPDPEHRDTKLAREFAAKYGILDEMEPEILAMEENADATN